MAREPDGLPTPPDIAPPFDDLSRVLAGERRRRGREAMVKRAIDVIVAGFLTLCAAPIMLIIAAIITFTSPGGIFFRQQRVGRDGKTFVMLKFRTMYAHLADPRAERQSSRRDERVTPVGRLLRRTSLDELPQFLNVLKGDMSLVGPRPHALGTSASGIPLEIADPRYPLRHRAKPGITGLAQVSGSRGALVTVDQVSQRIDYDLEYIDRWSLGLDLKIMFRTALLMLIDKDVY